jgi:hypothetical protein
MIYQYRRTRQPQAGADAYAFHNSIRIGQEALYLKQTNNQFIMNPISPLQPPQLYYPMSLTTTVGLGGLVYDSQYFSPLLVPNGDPYAPSLQGLIGQGAS